MKIKIKSKKVSKKKVYENKVLKKKPSPPIIIKLGKDSDVLSFQFIDSNTVNEISPTMKWYPEYTPELWNHKNTVQKNNCYSYAIGIIKGASNDKAQPGYFSSYARMKDTEYNCPTFFKRMKGDIPGIYQEHFIPPCQKGFHKIFLAITDQDADDRDYHYYVQNRNGLFSHKPGFTKATNKDASGNLIYNPLRANRDNGSYNYSTPCGFYCVNKKMARTRSYTTKTKTKKKF
jgi:hypothetical protein